MKHHLIIDSCVYLSYARYKKLYRISYCVLDYGLQVFIDSFLLSELKKNLPKMLFKTGLDVQEALDEIEGFTIMKETIPIFSKSPDPKDNFLFNLAIQTQSEVIVTKEKVLLSFNESPVQIHDIKWFKETYPVNL